METSFGKEMALRRLGVPERLLIEYDKEGKTETIKASSRPTATNSRQHNNQLTEGELKRPTQIKRIFFNSV